MDSPELVFTEAPMTPALQYLLDGMIQVRRDLHVDPMIQVPWCCDPKRCRPRLGPNLCCKVQQRCRHLASDHKCSIHDGKPFLCALFPLDLVRLGSARVITTPSNLDFFVTGWSRYDRDMLRCFEGQVDSPLSMYEQQATILRRVFSPSELRAVERALGALCGKGVRQGV